ncbi:GntR family transcriptional regulator [Amycolatopsis nigrescens]|uniref:GntR family transcriptional regulator n=1 Tax=Amycolatopsis nigrescens TaxID=381445 RepID=UPI000381219A|nr:GntR family transcriptional regulator [Amycolatopsis nigrescens]
MAPPLYLRIRAELEERIRSGDLPPGTRLPTEAELREQHGVSRATAQRVLHELAQAGLVVRHRRRGTFVADGVRQENLLRFVNPQLTGPEIPGRHAVHSAAVIPASDAEVELPGLGADQPVTQLVRLKFDVDENPIAVEFTAVPFALAPRLLDEDLVNLTMMPYFARQGVPVAKSRMYLDPVLLEKRHADLLAIAPGQPVLRQRRLTWLTNGEIAESGAYFLRPGMMDFYIEHSVLAE